MDVVNPGKSVVDVCARLQIPDTEKRVKNIRPRVLSAVIRQGELVCYLFEAK